MEYAVVKTGGKQYKVSIGDVIEVEKLAGKPNDDYTFSEVLLHVADSKVTVGKPAVSGLTVQGVLLADTRGPKIYVSKFKAKARYRRVTGHRQKLTRVRIESIGNNKKVYSLQAKKVERVEKVEAKPVKRVLRRKTAK